MEEGGVRGGAAVAHIACPLLVFWASVISAFSAIDHPRNAGEVKSVEWADCRLIADESHDRRNTPQIVSSVGIIVVFDAGSKPDILIPVSPVVWQNIFDVLRTFGQQLKVQSRIFSDGLPDFRAQSFCVGVIFGPVHERADEYEVRIARSHDSRRARFRQPSLLPELVFGCLDGLPVRSGAPEFQSHAVTGELLSVAVQAAWADLPASHPEVRRHVRPGYKCHKINYINYLT